MTVAELAKECAVKDQDIFKELRHLGLYVSSSAATIDPKFVETIRKKILSQKEAQEDKKNAAAAKREKERAKREKEKEKEKEKGGKTPRVRTSKPKPVQPEDKTPAIAAPGEPGKAGSAAPASGKGGASPVETPKPTPPPASEPVVEVVAAPADAAPVKKKVRVKKAPKEEPAAPVSIVVNSETPATSAPEGGEQDGAHGGGGQVAQNTPGSPENEEGVVAVASMPAPPVEGAAPTDSPDSTPPAPTPGGGADKQADAPGGGKKDNAAVPVPKPPKPPKPAVVIKDTAPVPAPRTNIVGHIDIAKYKPGRPDFRPGGAPQQKTRYIRKGGAQGVRVRHGGARTTEPIRPRDAKWTVPSNPEEFKPIDITEGVTIKELADKMDNVPAKAIIQNLLKKGIIAGINQTLDVEAAKNVCAEFGFRASVISFEDEAVSKQEIPDNPEDYVTRPPVVTIMGHVDHGKTSLLDVIRETNVTATEAGGITQHIGAYQVEIPVEGRERSIVFLDTPGHEAFTMMRARGAQATDIVVLVVAADDGVMPQTIEAIHHSRAAGVPIIVAINKIDKPGAQVDRVKQALADQGLLAEDWGGETVTVEVSAKQRIHIDLLLEMIVLVADMRDLKANPKRLASGVVLEAKVDRGRGNVATVLVQNGTLRQGDAFVAGSAHGRVRALVNDRGRAIESAGPSIPAEIMGLQDLPLAGDIFQVFDDANRARQVAEFRKAKEREASLQKTSRLSLQALYDQMRDGVVKELPLIVKADVQGSVEVVSEMLNKLSTDKVKVKILHSGAGAVTETDVLLASASNAIVIGFNVRPERKAQELADTEGVEIRLYTVIYNLTNEITAAMIGMLEKTIQEKYVGRAEVRDTFRVPKFGVIAGCLVQDGLIKRNSDARLLRDNAVIHEGKIASLRRFKEDASEVKSGFECGIGFEHYSDIKVGDVIEAYVIEKIQPTSL
jgi:translation initiation factor IF-2